VNNSLKKLVVFYLNNTINLRPINTHCGISYPQNGDRIMTMDPVSSVHPMYITCWLVLFRLNFICYVVGPHFIVLLLYIVRKKIRPNFEEPTHLFSLLSTKPAGSFISKASRCVSSFFLRVQLSQPYVATGHTGAFIGA